MLNSLGILGHGPDAVVLVLTLHWVKDLPLRVLPLGEPHEVDQLACEGPIGHGKYIHAATVTPAIGVRPLASSYFKKCLLVLRFTCLLIIAICLLKALAWAHSYKNARDTWILSHED